MDPKYCSSCVGKSLIIKGHPEDFKNWASEYQKTSSKVKKDKVNKQKEVTETPNKLSVQTNKHQIANDIQTTMNKTKSYKNRLSIHHEPKPKVPCKHWLRFGQCNYGNDCKFGHDPTCKGRDARHHRQQKNVDLSIKPCRLVTPTPSPKSELLETHVSPTSSTVSSESLLSSPSPMKVLCRILTPQPSPTSELLGSFEHTKAMTLPLPSSISETSTPLSSPRSVPEHIQEHTYDFDVKVDQRDLSTPRDFSAPTPLPCDFSAPTPLPCDFSAPPITEPRFYSDTMTGQYDVVHYGFVAQPQYIWVPWTQENPYVDQRMYPTFDPSFIPPQTPFFHWYR